MNRNIPRDKRHTHTNIVKICVNLQSRILYAVDISLSTSQAMCSNGSPKRIHNIHKKLGELKCFESYCMFKLVSAGIGTMWHFFHFKCTVTKGKEDWLEQNILNKFYVVYGILEHIYNSLK